MFSAPSSCLCGQTGGGLRGGAKLCSHVNDREPTCVCRSCMSVNKLQANDGVSLITDPVDWTDLTSVKSLVHRERDKSETKVNYILCWVKVLKTTKNCHNFKNTCSQSNSQSELHTDDVFLLVTMVTASILKASLQISTREQRRKRQIPQFRTTTNKNPAQTVKVKSF